MDLEALGVMVLRVRPIAVVLSVVTGVGPSCGCPISAIAAVEQGGKFCFRSRGHDVFDDGRKNKNGTVVEIWFVLFGEIKISGCSTFAFGFGEIGAISIKGKDHITCAIPDGCIWMCDCIINELFAGV